MNTAAVVTYHFCTYFDRSYLARGLALYRSLLEHCREFSLWILCMDDATYEILERLHLVGVYLISMEQFERDDEFLQAAKQNRSRIEYYFTTTPSLPLYILNHWPEVGLITYLDADLFFFASPAPLFEEMGQGSIAIIPHRFPPNQRHRERFGRYNVGWLSFRRDQNAISCLDWWRDRCIEWCYDRIENDRFADQKYLDEWPNRFDNVVVLEHLGANLALWNVANYDLHYRHGNIVMVDSHELIFFHFHGLRRITQFLYDPRWAREGVTPSTVLRRGVYGPYIQALQHVSYRLLPTFDASHLASIRRLRDREGQQQSLLRRCLGRSQLWLCAGANILRGRYLIVIGGHVI